jgi:hypothetical protein
MTVMEKKKSDSVLKKDELERVFHVRETIREYEQTRNNYEMWDRLISRIQQVYSSTTKPTTVENNMVSVVAIHDDNQKNWENLVFETEERAWTEKPSIYVIYRSHLLDLPIRLPVIHIDIINRPQISLGLLELSLTIDPLFLVAPGASDADADADDADADADDDAHDHNFILRVLKPITINFEFTAHHFINANKISPSKFCRNNMAIESENHDQLTVGKSWLFQLVDDDYYSGHFVQVGSFELQLDDLLTELDAAIFRTSEIKRLLPSWIKCLPLTMFPIICSFL